MTISTPSRAKRRCQDSGFTPNGQKVDNSGSTIQMLFDLYHTAELCDVQLQVGYRLFHAHKLILSMSSDVFKTMLTDTKWPDAHKNCILLSEDPECVQVFGEFLQYMYTGIVQLTNSSVLPILTLADKYNLHQLAGDCKHYMASHSHAALQDLRYVILCEDRELELSIRCYMELNFNHVMQSEDFLTMRLDTLEQMLRCPHLVIHSEFALFTSLKDWFLHNVGSSVLCEQDGGQGPGRSSPDPFRKNLEKRTFLKLMSYVRFPTMKEAQLLAVYSDPLYQGYTSVSAAPPVVKQAAFHVGVLPPPHRDRHGVCSTPDDMATPAEGGRYGHGQRLHMDTNFGSSPSCGRIVFQQNSDSRIVPRKRGSPERLSACSSACCAVQASSSASRTPPFPLAAHRGERAHLPTSSFSGRLSPLQCPSLVCNPNLSLGKGSSAYCSPRNYTCDDWSVCLTIEEFASFPCYGSQAYFFSTPASAIPSCATSMSDRRESPEDMEDSSLLEWQAELYPRGIRFPGARMICIPKSYDIDESCRDVVRLALFSKTRHHQPCRVDVNVLAVACGLADGTEYVEALTHRTFIFDEGHMVLNIDDIVPFWQLNCARSTYLTDSVLFPGKRESCFKLVLIIKPAS